MKKARFARVVPDCYRALLLLEVPFHPRWHTNTTLKELAAQFESTGS